MSTDLEHPVTNKAIRLELEQWLEENWSPDRPLLEWRNILVDGGWAATGWPQEYYGRGYNREQVGLVFDVFRKKGAVGACLLYTSPSPRDS